MRGRSVRLLAAVSLLSGLLVATNAGAEADEPHGPSALLIAGSTAPPGGDSTVVERVEAAGLPVSIVDDDADLEAVDLSDVALLLISTSVRPHKVDAVFRDSPLPILIWEPYLFDEMEISLSGETTGTHRAVVVSDPASDLAAGFGPGRVDVYRSPNRLNYGRVCGDAEVAAHVPGATGKASVFGYAAGAERCDGSLSPGPRVGMFPNFPGSSKVTADGIEFIDAAIDWLVSTPSCATQTDVSVSECAALVDLFDSTNGADEDDGWRETADWLDFDAGPCDWFGVICLNGILRGLELDGNGLSGELRPSIGDLVNLTELRLDGNDIGGELPPEVAVDGLEFLWLDHNDFTGPIPPEIGGLDHLGFLSMVGNSFTGPIPDEFGQLSGVSTFALSRNELSGPIPASLGGLANVRRLHLAHNDLSGKIPTEIGDLRLLEQLDLEHNRLSGPLPDSLWTVPTLKQLHAFANELAGPISDAIQDPPLNRLLLHGNGCLTASESTATYIASFDHLWDDGCATAILVAGRSRLLNGDEIFHERLVTAGFDVIIVDDDRDLAALDLSGIHLLAISTSVVASKVGDALSDARLPIIVWEPLLFDDLALSMSGETSTIHRTIRIADSAHPIAARHFGNVAVYRQPHKLNFGAVCGGADVIAHVPGSTQKATVFAYETVDKRCDGSLAPGRRVALFPTYAGAQELTPAGIEIIDAAIAWSRLPDVLQDNDGVLDADDNCPSTLAGTTNFNILQPDTDGDGTGDDCDASATTSSSGRFAPVSTLSTAAPHDVDVADMNGDGHLDIVVGTDAFDAGIEVWLSDGAGSFVDPGDGISSFASEAIALGDLDMDGDIDIFDANPPGVWLNSGDGVSFSERGTSDLLMNAADVALGDVDSDGDLDAFLAAGHDRVFLNDGAGNFEDSGQRLGLAASGSVALADIDADGDLDAFVTDRSAESFPGIPEDNRLWINDGHGVFSPGVLPPDTGAAPFDADFADLNGDGSQDLFLGQDDDSRVLLNDGNGTLVDTGQSLAGFALSSVSLGDIDGDGDVDAVLPVWTKFADDAANAVWLNDGTGVFTPSDQEIGSFDFARDGVMGDVDGDGDLDAIVGSDVPTAVTIWENDPCAAQSDIPAVDCEALLALFHSTNGPDWTDNSNWLDMNAGPCEWHGVICWMDEGFVAIELRENGLSGPIPSRLGDLSTLRSLNLERNDLSGRIPTRLGDIATLEWLNLRNNLLSEEIPTDLRLLSNLEFLGLSDNDLTGPIPVELGELSSLTNLALARNNLEGSIPRELGNLSELRFLDLLANQLTGEIPTELGHLLELERLMLGFNQLTGSIPESLHALVNLTDLWLGHNQLTNDDHLPFIFPTAFDDLDNLRALALDHNQLEGQVPDEILTMDALQPIPNSVPPIVQLGGNGCLTANDHVATYLDAVSAGWDDGCI